MVAGRLQEKNGFYYIVLSYTDSAGKRRQPWIGTGLPVKGNKKRAEKMLAETRKDFTIPKGQVSELSPDMAFSDYSPHRDQHPHRWQEGFGGGRPRQNKIQSAHLAAGRPDCGALKSRQRTAGIQPENLRQLL